MALWGNDDSKAVSGTISVTQNSKAVVGAGTSFLTALAPGQTLFIVGVEYRIESITSNTALTLVTAYAATTASGLTVTASEQPAYIPVADMPVVFGISTGEAQNATNIAKGVNTPGWVRHEQYSNAGSITRRRTEVLVAGKFIAGDADSTTFPG